MEVYISPGTLREPTYTLLPLEGESLLHVLGGVTNQYKLATSTILLERDRQ